MKSIVFALIVAVSTFTVYAQSTPPQAKPVVRNVIPKDTNTATKLKLNESETANIDSQFQTRIQQDYYKNVLPALNALSAEKADLIKQIKVENGWDATYAYDDKTQTWTTTSSVK